MRSKDLAGAQCAVEVGLQDLIPLALGYLQCRGPLDASGAVYQNMDTAKLGQSGIQQRLQTFSVVYIRGYSKRAPAGLANSIGRRFYEVSPPAGGHDVGAGLGHAFSECQADA